MSLSRDNLPELHEIREHLSRALQAAKLLDLNEVTTCEQSAEKMLRELLTRDQITPMEHDLTLARHNATVGLVMNDLIAESGNNNINNESEIMLGVAAWLRICRDSLDKMLVSDISIEDRLLFANAMGVLGALPLRNDDPDYLPDDDYTQTLQLGLDLLCDLKTNDKATREEIDMLRQTISSSIIDMNEASIKSPISSLAANQSSLFGGHASDQHGSRQTKKEMKSLVADMCDWSDTSEEGDSLEFSRNSYR